MADATNNGNGDTLDSTEALIRLLDSDPFLPNSSKDNRVEKMYLLARENLIFSLQGHSGKINARQYLDMIAVAAEKAKAKGLYEIISLEHRFVYTHVRRVNGELPEEFTHRLEGLHIARAY
jgi:hypothetical protein